MLPLDINLTKVKARGYTKTNDVEGARTVTWRDEWIYYYDINIIIDFPW